MAVPGISAARRQQQHPRAGMTKWAAPTAWRMFQGWGAEARWGSHVQQPLPAKPIEKCFFDMDGSGSCCPLLRVAAGYAGVSPCSSAVAGTAVADKVPAYSRLNWWDGVAGSKCSSQSQHSEMRPPPPPIPAQLWREVRKEQALAEPLMREEWGARPWGACSRLGKELSPSGTSWNALGFLRSAVILVPLLNVNQTFLFFPFLAETSVFNARKQ